jgi:hypothetical protein
MTMLKESITSRVARDQAFAYISDWARQAEWDPNTVSAAQIGEGGPAVGSRYALEVKYGTSTKPMEYRITELEAPSRLVLIGEGSGVWSEDILEFSEVEGGTRVDYQAEIKLSGLLGLIQPLLKRQFDAIGDGVVVGMQRELDKLADASA